MIVALGEADREKRALPVRFTLGVVERVIEKREVLEDDFVDVAVDDAVAVLVRVSGPIVAGRADMDTEFVDDVLTDTLADDETDNDADELDDPELDADAEFDADAVVDAVDVDAFLRAADSRRRVVCIVANHQQLSAHRARRNTDA